MSSAKNWQYLTAFVVEAKDNFLCNVLICAHMAYFFPRCIYFFSKRLFLVNGEVKQIFEIFKLISNIAVNSSAMDCKVPQWPGLIRGLSIIFCLSGNKRRKRSIASRRDLQESSKRSSRTSIFSKYGKPIFLVPTNLMSSMVVMDTPHPHDLNNSYCLIDYTGVFFT